MSDTSIGSVSNCQSDAHNPKNKPKRIEVIIVIFLLLFREVVIKYQPPIVSNACHARAVQEIEMGNGASGVP